MTREEASNILDDYDVNFDGHTAEEIAEAFEVAFRALEQAPCEDAISRSDMLDAIGHGTTYTSEELQRIIMGLPPVNPQPKTGHWIHFAASDECSECGWSTGKYNSPSKYCPNCGIKMIDVHDTNVGKLSEIPTGSDDELYSDCIDAFKEYALARK